MTRIAFICNGCGNSFVTMSAIYKTAVKQLHRAQWSSERGEPIGDHGYRVIRICPKCKAGSREGTC